MSAEVVAPVKTRVEAPTVLDRNGTKYKLVPGLFYKFFTRRTTTESEPTYPCGHPGCTDHRTYTKDIKLYSPYKSNTSLQKAGDSAVTDSSPLVCHRGWHAVRLAKIGGWLNHALWTNGTQVMFECRLYGLKHGDKDKVSAQGVFLVEEIKPDSPKGKRLIERANTARKAYEARLRRQEAETEKKRRDQRIAERKRQELRDLQSAVKNNEQMVKSYSEQIRRFTERAKAAKAKLAAIQKKSKTK